MALKREWFTGTNMEHSKHRQHQQRPRRGPQPIRKNTTAEGSTRQQSGYGFARPNNGTDTYGGRHSTVMYTTVRHTRRTAAVPVHYQYLGTSGYTNVCVILWSTRYSKVLEYTLEVLVLPNAQILEIYWQYTGSILVLPTYSQYIERMYPEVLVLPRYCHSILVVLRYSQ